MPKRHILATIDAIYDDDGVAFTCEGEPLEDMEFAWEDLADPELCAEVGEELVDFVDAEDLEDVDNPLEVVEQALRRLRNSPVARRALEDFDEDEEPDDDDD